MPPPVPCRAGWCAAAKRHQPEPVHPALTPELVETYRREGVVVVRGAFSPDDLALAEAGIEGVLADPGPLALRASPEDDAAFVEDFCRWGDVPELRQLALEGPGGQLTADLTGARQVRLYHDHVLVKEPGTRQRTPWHQDQPYYNIDGSDTVSFWIPLDPVPRESTLEFVAGSHAGTWYMPRSFFDDRALVFDEGAFDEVPDVEADRDAYEILGWPLEPGDAVAFNMLTLHAAAGSRNRRRAFSVRLVGDDVRLAKRPHATSPPFPELNGRLAPGDALDHPLFPRLWPRA